jgi:hypothetical protein
VEALDVSSQEDDRQQQRGTVLSFDAATNIYRLHFVQKFAVKMCI